MNFTAGVALSLLLLPLFHTHAQAQAWPSKPVRVVNAYAPGGPTDFVARPILQHLSDTFGQSFYMENKAGANGNIGAEEVVRAAPDGYTLLVGTNSQVTINTALYKMPFDAQRDLAPITQISTNPSSIVLNAAFPAKNMQELITYARANPGKLVFGSAGPGSINHLAGELLATLTGTKLLHVPFKGGGPTITELLAGRIDLFIVSPPLVLPHVKAGKLKIVMLSADKRMAQIPDVPTMTEAGLPEFRAAGGTGMLAPSKTPPPIIRRLQSEIAKFLRSQEGEAKFADLGIQIVASTPEEYAQVIREETTRWTAVVRAGNIKAE